MVSKRTWDEFRNTGLLLFINSFLHIFGWAICVEVDVNNLVILAYPSRVKFRGFDAKNIDEAYKKLSIYMADNAIELKKEADE